jgi:hypothetical protein
MGITLKKKIRAPNFLLARAPKFLNPALRHFSKSRRPLMVRGADFGNHWNSVSNRLRSVTNMTKKVGLINENLS